MDENKFKKANRPAACNNPPWAAVIPKNIREDVLRQIKQESVQFHGQNLDECPKRLTCFGKQCAGRPLPILSPTAKPYIEKLKTTHKIENDELFLSNCDSCSIASTCRSACAQVNDFMQRDKIKEPSLDYRGTIDNLAEEVQPLEVATIALNEKNKIPWDSLSEKRKQTVQKYLYEQKDFMTVAKELGYYDQASAKREFYFALTTLAKYATMRKFIENKGHLLKSEVRELLVYMYIDNMSLTDAAKKQNRTKQSAKNIIDRTVKKYGITWTKFAKNEYIDDSRKIVYKVAEVLK